MKTNRRTFMQRCFVVLGGVVVAFVPSKAKPAVVFAPRKPKEWAEFTVDLNPEVMEYYKFKGYHFWATGNEIHWQSNIMFLDNQKKRDSAILPTHDRIRYFHAHKDQLFWVGEHETWEIQYVGLRDTKFQWIRTNSEIHSTTNVCYCHKPGNHVACNYSKCRDYNPGNKKPYKEEYE